MSDISTESATPIREYVAEELRALLARRQMSATELARRIGATQPYIWRRMSAEIAFDIDDLQRIAAVLGVEVSDLLPARPRASSPVLLDPLAPRIVAVGGEHRQPRKNKPVHPQVPTSRAVVTKRTRPVTPIAV